MSEAPRLEPNPFMPGTRFVSFQLAPSDYGVLIFALDSQGQLWQVAIAGDGILNGWQRLPTPEEFPYSPPRRPDPV